MSSDKGQSKEEWRDTENAMGMILSIIAVLVVVVLVISGLVAFSKDWAKDLNSWEDADRTWTTTKIIELQSLKNLSSQKADIQHKSGGLGGSTLLVKIDDQEKFKYVYKTNDGGYKLDSISTDNSTIYEIEDNEKPRIEYKKCYFDVPENKNQKNSEKDSIIWANPFSPNPVEYYDGKLCNDYDDTPDKIEIYVPRGSISDDISIGFEK